MAKASKLHPAIKAISVIAKTTEIKTGNTGGRAAAARITKAAKTAPPAKAAPKANPDKIAEVKGTASGPDHIIVSAGEHNVAIPRSKFVGALTKLAVVGGSLRAVQDYIATHKTPAKLAHGLDGRTAPQSAMAAAESNRSKPAPVATARTAPTARKAASNNPKLGDGQKITVVAKANPYKAGTKAAATFDLFVKAGTVGGFKALVAKAPSNYDGSYIRYSSRDGYIKIG